MNPNEVSYQLKLNEQRVKRVYLEDAEEYLQFLRESLNMAQVITPEVIKHILALDNYIAITKSTING